MERIKEITNKLVESREWPEFGAGDTITVTVKIKEGLLRSVFRPSKVLFFNVVELVQLKHLQSVRCQAALV